MHEMLKKMLEGMGKNLGESDEEQKMGMKIFKSLIPRLDQNKISDWLFCEEWDDVLVPVRLPKGITEQFRQMDSARTEIIEEDCEDCKGKANCPLIQRNPSEVLLTTLMKYSFARIIAEIKIKEVMTDARQDGSDIHPEV